MQSDDIFGGQLSITDAFSTTFSKFTSSVTGATSSFNSFIKEVGVAEKANRLSMNNMQKDVQRYADFYVKEWGYTLPQALRKAKSEVEKVSPTTGNAWADVFGKIKQVGIDSFDSINNRVEAFSNSTLGTIAKLTAGFASFEGIKKGVTTGFETGEEYQNLRLVLDNLYGNSQTGGEKFKMSTDFASNSIWQEKDVVRSLAMLKGSGLDDSKNSLTEMSDLGSYAKAMGVGDINTSTRAYSEMMMGRWNMMAMDLNINRGEVENFAKQNNMKSFDNKNGKITDKNALETAFKAYMDERGFTGLTDKMKNTFTGRMSTLKDNINKSLADLIGVGNDGAVKSGSIFSKFCDGMTTFTTKIQQFSNSDKFEKFSNELTKFGDALFNGFSYLLDHPDIITDVLEFGVAIWSLGKISSIISAVTTIAGIFGEGGIFASLAPILLPIAPIILGIAGGFFALKAILGDDFISESIQGWGMFFDWFGGKVEDFLKWIGIDIGDSKPSTTSNDNYKWYGGKDGKTLMNGQTQQYPTIPNALASGQVTQNETNNNSSAANKTEINMNIAKVEKTADVDEIMDQVTQRMDKYSQTRNKLN